MTIPETVNFKLLQLKESRRELNQLLFSNRMIVVYLGASLISFSSHGFPPSCFDVKLMNARVEQNFSCSSQSLMKQTVTATSYSKFAAVSLSLTARTLT